VSGPPLLFDNEELPSQDSLLNEQEFNYYFKNTPAINNNKDRFSIEDFKNLDKQKLL
jgi:hypothetical protein